MVDDIKLRNDIKIHMSQYKNFIKELVSSNIIVIGDPNHGEESMKYIKEIFDVSEPEIRTKLKNAIFFAEDKHHGEHIKSITRNFFSLDKECGFYRQEVREQVKRDFSVRMYNHPIEWINFINNAISELGTDRLLIICIGRAHLYPYYNYKDRKIYPSFQSLLKADFLSKKIVSFAINKGTVVKKDTYPTEYNREVPPGTAGLKNLSLVEYFDFHDYVDKPPLNVYGFIGRHIGKDFRWILRFKKILKKITRENIKKYKK
jgi:hypothetical protein